MGWATSSDNINVGPPQRAECHSRIAVVVYSVTAKLIKQGSKKKEKSFSI